MERERAKPLEGRAAAAHVDCCVLCGCVLCCDGVLFTQFVERVELAPNQGENMQFFVRRQREGDKKEKVTDGAKQNWRAAGALRIFRFFLVYVD